MESIPDDELDLFEKPAIATIATISERPTASDARLGGLRWNARVGRPATDYVRLVYNAKHLEYLQDRIM